jgi:hypothetical protein
MPGHIETGHAGERPDHRNPKAGQAIDGVIRPAHPIRRVRRNADRHTDRIAPSLAARMLTLSLISTAQPPPRPQPFRLHQRWRPRRHRR